MTALQTEKKVKGPPHVIQGISTSLAFLKVFQVFNVFTEPHYITTISFVGWFSHCSWAQKQMPSGTQCPNFMSQPQRLMSTFTSAPDTLVLFALYLLYHPCIYSELEPLHQKADHSLFVSIFYCIVAPRTNKKPTFKQISKFCSVTSPTHCVWTGAASSMFCRKQRAGPGKIRKAGGREMTCWQFSV